MIKRGSKGSLSPAAKALTHQIGPENGLSIHEAAKKGGKTNGCRPMCPDCAQKTVAYHQATGH